MPEYEFVTARNPGGSPVDRIVNLAHVITVEPHPDGSAVLTLTHGHEELICDAPYAALRRRLAAPGGSHDWTAASIAREDAF